MADIELWEHQKKAIEKAQEIALGPSPSGMAFLMEVGTGKTPTMARVLAWHCNNQKRIVPTLIFCPPVVIKNWVRELKRWTKIPPERIIPLMDSGKKRLEALNEARKRYRGDVVAITNYEAVQMPDLLDSCMQWSPFLLVNDESHRLKNHQALRTKRITMLADRCKYIYNLTGTPVLNNPMDLFSQFRILDGGRTFGKNFFIFRSQYFYDKNAAWRTSQKYFPAWVPRADAQEKLGKLIAGRSFQAKKSECLTLPPLVRQRIEVELSPPQKKAYDEMYKDFITFVREADAVVAELAITKTLRLQQILSGFARTDAGVDVPFKDVPRLTALRDLLEDLTEGAKCIVWANFKANYQALGAICDELGCKYVSITGEQSTAEKDEAAQAFENDPEVRVVIANPQAGGEGINLIAASQMIYYTRDFSLGKDIQSEARAYRGGSERHEKITRWDIVAPGTVDEVVLEALEKKQSVAEAILAVARGRK